MRWWTKVGWLAIAMTLGTACDSANAQPDAAQPDADPRCVDLGEPAALEIGGPIMVVLGPQDLYMVTPSIRAWGVIPGEAGRIHDPDDPIIAIDLFLETERIGWSARDHLGLTVTADGAEKSMIWVPIYVELDIFIDRRVTLRGEITDVCGNTATDTLDVVLVQ